MEEHPRPPSAVQVVDQGDRPSQRTDVLDEAEMEWTPVDTPDATGDSMHHEPAPCVFCMKKHGERERERE
jgi:hypothetical protein